MFELMVEYSERYLYEFFQSIEQSQRKSIGLMGGWAAYLLLAKRETKHIGSRDIDIFYNPKRVAFEDVTSKIEAIGVKPHSTFRWSKFVQISTGKELTETASKKLPLHDVATIFFDLASPEKIGRAAMTVPLLSGVFEGDFEICKFKELEILTPSAKIMIEMKLASAGEREDEFKRAKDLADLFALLNYDIEHWRLDSQGRRISTKDIDKALVEGFKQNIDRLISDGSIAQAANMLKVDDDVVIQLLNNM